MNSSSLEDIMSVLRSLDPKDEFADLIIEPSYVSGEPEIPAHYESTCLSVSSDQIYLADICESDTFKSKYEVKTTEGVIAVAKLVLYFGVDIADRDNILDNLFEAMQSYSDKNRLTCLDGFILLFEKLEIKYESTYQL